MFQKYGKKEKFKRQKVMTATDRWQPPNERCTIYANFAPLW